MRTSAWNAVSILSLVVLACTGVWRARFEPAASAREITRTTARATGAVPAEPVSLEGAAIMGRADAPLGVLVFSDFQCPFSAKFAKDTIPALEERFVRPGHVALIFRHLPLEPIHPMARPAAEGAECARQQDRFWPLHDRLFANARDLTTDDIRRHALAAGVDAGAFGACLAADAAATVGRDVIAAGALGVVSTPTIFIGRIDADGRLKVTERFSGPLPIAQLEKVLAGLVKE